MRDHTTTNADGSTGAASPTNANPTSSRRGAMQAIGGSAVIGVALTACGASPEQTANSAASAAGKAASSGASAAASAVASAADSLVKAAEIPVGGGKIIAALKVVITQPTAGDFKAFSSICTHQGCPVTSVEGGTINCPCHGSKFDIATGAVTQGPARSGLAAKSVTVGADGITVT